MEQVLPAIYQIQVPLPQNPLRAVNCYLIRGHRDLLIDVGMNRRACREVLFPALQTLQVNKKRLDLFITHLHADHLGLASDFGAMGCTIYFNREEGEIIKKDDFWEGLYASSSRNGFPLKKLKEAIQKHPGYRYGSQGDLSFSYLEDGDEIEVGDYQLTCISTPGHSPGHLCLYEPKKGILFSGDHILEQITPNITGITQSNPLKSYLTSLEKVKALTVHQVLPGHRRVFTHCQERIEELKVHHFQRNQEILTILQEGPKTPYQVAGKMQWDLSYSCWSQFPIPQQWFATGEALAHLRYLQGEGQVVVQIREGMDHYERGEI